MIYLFDNRFRQILACVFDISVIVELELVLNLEVSLIISSDVAPLVATVENLIIDALKVGVFYICYS